jgi:hypothetical protein
MAKNMILKFKTPTSLKISESFRSYASSHNVKTTGDFTVAGFAKGLYSDTTYPNSMLTYSPTMPFKYPNLPKSVQNIVIDTKIVNETGNSK